VIDFGQQRVEGMGFRSMGTLEGPALRGRMEEMAGGGPSAGLAQMTADAGDVRSLNESVGAVDNALQKLVESIAGAAADLRSAASSGGGFMTRDGLRNELFRDGQR
jgi:hypothetical protein